ncbi:uncharacterized protein LOC121981640 isoform X2 [Zingiber officinale]|uniref:uncharacterized protein LOC121981640 isoform X2 n=1 Tax=Zingiber officinale TaxID=94328 RepID=UPI001C4BF554|nr:uncharacterized protein LOC121981640 isoform X2 [Zingiber officinale]
MRFQQWATWMGLMQKLSALAQNNASLKQRVSEAATVHAPNRLSELETRLHKAQGLAKIELEKVAKLKTALETSETQLCLEVTRRAKMRADLDEKTVEVEHLSAQMKELKTIHVSELAIKESELVAQKTEWDSLRSDLDRPDYSIY